MKKLSMGLVHEERHLAEQRILFNMHDNLFRAAP